MDTAGLEWPYDKLQRIYSVTMSYPVEVGPCHYQSPGSVSLSLGRCQLSEVNCVAYGEIRQHRSCLPWKHVVCSHWGVKQALSSEFCLKSAGRRLYIACSIAVYDLWTHWRSDFLICLQCLTANQMAANSTKRAVPRFCRLQRFGREYQRLPRIASALYKCNCTV